MTSAEVRLISYDETLALEKLMMNETLAGANNSGDPIFMSGTAKDSATEKEIALPDASTQV